jgi:hypothetical protein
MVAIEAKYHPRCRTALQNRARSELKNSTTYPVKNSNHALALAEVISFMEDQIAESRKVPVFRLAELCALYEERLKELGMDERVHSTRLKNRILHALPNLTPAEQGRDILLSYNIGDALVNACDDDDDAIPIMRAVKAIRKEIFNTKSEFSGVFDANCQADSVPPNLIRMLQMLLYGSANELLTPRAAEVSIAQLIAYNCVHRPEQNGGPPRHSKDRETPLPIYVALKIYGTVRSRSLIDMLHRMGMCISYHRMLDLTNELGNAVCEQFEKNWCCVSTQTKTGSVYHGCGRQYRL